MEKITKKDFMELHNNKKIRLIQSIPKTKEVCLQLINDYLKINILSINSFKESITKEVTRIDINDVKNYSKTNCYKHDNYYFVEFLYTDKVYGNSIKTICYIGGF
jgi:hypothetical protein